MLTGISIKKLNISVRIVSGVKQNGIPDTCQDVSFPKGLGMKNKPERRIRSVCYGLKCCFGARFLKMRVQEGIDPEPVSARWFMTLTDYLVLRPLSAKYRSAPG